MDLVELVSLGLNWLGSLTIGGIIGSIIGLKWKNKTEKARAEQEEARAEQEEAKTDEAELSNITTIIRLYREAIEDLKKAKDESDDINLKKLSDNQKIITELEVKVHNLSEDLQVKNQMISELTRTQLKYKLDLDSLQASNINNCETCEFHSNCDKFKAKKVKYESLNR